MKGLSKKEKREKGFMDMGQQGGDREGLEVEEGQVVMEKKK